MLYRIMKFVKRKKEKRKIEKNMISPNINSNVNPKTNLDFPDNNLPQYEFDIEVQVDTDDYGNPVIERQNNVISDSEESLFTIYAMCNQPMRILNKRKIKDGKKQITDNPNNQQKKPLENEVKSPEKEKIIPPETIIPFDYGKGETVNEKKKEKKEEPKILNVSGVKIKIVDGKVYQKQWIRATEEESSSIRILSEATNKIMSMNGKFFEVEKWILVEDESVEKV